MKQKTAGIVLLVVGIFLTGFSIYLSVYLWRAVHGQGAHWNGTPEMTALTGRLMVILVAFGVCSTLTGLYQVVTARRSWILSLPILLATVGLLVTCYQIIQLKGP